MKELPLPEEYRQEIEDWIGKTKFRRKIFGGVDETDVWSKIRELNELYQKALAAERIRYDALLKEREKGVNGT